MNEASKFARESFDRTIETGAETVRGVQEGFTSALENVRDLNIRLINLIWREQTPMLLSTLQAKLQKPKRRRMWSRRGQRTRPNSLTC